MKIRLLLVALAIHFSSVGHASPVRHCLSNGGSFEILTAQLLQKQIHQLPTLMIIGVVTEDEIASRTNEEQFWIHQRVQSGHAAWAYIHPTNHHHYLISFHPQNAKAEKVLIFIDDLSDSDSNRRFFNSLAVSFLIGPKDSSFIECNNY